MKRLLCLMICALVLLVAALPTRAEKRGPWKFLEFDGQGHSEERALVLNLLRESYLARGETEDAQDLDDPEKRPRVFIALEDMDGDGTPEIFATFEAAFYCGADGCPFQLLQRGPDGTWRIIWDHICTPSHALAVGPLRNGLREVLFPGGLPSARDDLSCPVWGSTGTRYDLISRMPARRWPCREATARYDNGE